MKIYTYSTDGASLFRRGKSEPRRGKPALPDLEAEIEEEISFEELLKRAALAREAINTLDRYVNRRGEERTMTGSKKSQCGFCHFLRDPACKGRYATGAGVCRSRASVFSGTMQPPKSQACKQFQPRAADGEERRNFPA